MNNWTKDIYEKIKDKQSKMQEQQQQPRKWKDTQRNSGLNTVLMKNRNWTGKNKNKTE